MSPATARKIVPWGRIVYGAFAQVAPGPARRGVLIRPEDDKDGDYLMRIFGTRAMFLGAMSAGLAGEETARKALRVGVAVDTVDLVSLALAYKDGRVGKGVFAYNAVFGAVYGAMGVLAASGD